SIVSILTLGNLMMLSPSERDAAAPILQRAILNKKWRVREAVPLALRPLAEKDPAYIIALFRNWTAEGYPVMYRAAIEVLADKSILRKHPSTLAYLKEVHIKAMGEIEFHPKETGEPMELLKKALSSAIAILAVHDPSTIQLMEEWAKVPVLRPIVRSNIGEPMFRKRFPDETATLLDYIDKGI
ncbi:MAG: hypothetical protein QCI38_05000, partial [Candidatus Thermoplasmatota archaeon]|nr:hypothetical protein [Candidatus Thermoplasmatota archaeon]